MSSDPASYIQAHKCLDGRIALTLRGPLHEYNTTYELPRVPALKLLTGLSKALFATASPDPRPAKPAPVTDTDEIDAIVGALAALTDRVSALEASRTTPCDTDCDGLGVSFTTAIDTLRRELARAVIRSADPEVRRQTT